MSEPSVLVALVSGLRGGSIEVVGLTSRLSSSTPVIQLSPRPRSAPLLVDAKVVRDRGAWWPAEAFRGH